MTTQTFTIIVPPAIALFLSGWLRDNRLPRWLDTLIALITILATAAVWALFAGKLTGSLVVDMVIIAGYTAALVAGPMAALHDWLTINWTSPFAAFIQPEPIPVVRPAAPSAIITPAPSGLIPRSSLIGGAVTAPLSGAGTQSARASAEPVTIPTPDQQSVTPA